MWFKIAADLVIVLHLLLIVFIVLGGLLVLKWKRLWLRHIPAAVWGALVEYNNWLCPLTPLEQTGYSRTRSACKAPVKATFDNSSEMSGRWPWQES